MNTKTISRPVYVAFHIGRGFEFKPKGGEDTANALTGSYVGRKTDKFLLIGNDEKVANTVTAHYAKEKTSDLVRQSFGGGSYVMEKNK